MEAITAEILRLLALGLTLQPRTLHFSASTFSAATAEEIQAILDKGDESDRELLAEAAFFPDESFQVHLEPSLTEGALTREDIGRLKECISLKVERVFIHLPNEQSAFSLKVDLPLIDGFVNRLNLAYRLHPDLIDSLADSVNGGFLYRTRVMLRNARSSMSPVIRDWFLRLAGCIGNSREWPAILDFVLPFLGTMTDESNLYEELIRLKRIYFSALQRLERHEEQIQKTNMETVMAMGLRMGHIQREKALLTIGIIDRICLALYGQTERLEYHEMDIDVGDDASGGHIENIIKALT
ncbi:MAG: hypothetical protein R6U50_14430 [Desulfobacterales bacterium]